MLKALLRSYHQLNLIVLLVQLKLLQHNIVLGKTMNFNTQLKERFPWTFLQHFGRITTGKQPSVLTIY